MKQNKLIWLLRILAAAIMLQTLYFKFTAAPESVFVFQKLGLEPCGRIGIGVLELLASLMLLIPITSVMGAILSMGLMSGAIFSHLTKLGIQVMNDGGQLFIYALIVLICSSILAWVQRKHFFILIGLSEKYWI